MRVIGKILVGMMVANMAVGCQQKEKTTYNLLVGTYGQGIHQMVYYPGATKFEEISVLPAVNPSYVALGASAQGIYSVSENGEKSGAYYIPSDTATVAQPLVSGNGADPCYILPVGDGQYFYTADYTGGSLTSFALTEGGVKAVEKIQFTGSGPVADRQASAHIHQVKPLWVDGKEGWLLVTDLGSDCIHVMKYLGEGRAEERSRIECGAGSGPRHMEFNADQTKLYVITELSGEVIVYDLEVTEGQEAEAGQEGKAGRVIAEEIQRIVADEVNAGGSADIHMSADGRYLYTSHRLQNDGVAVFQVADCGTLTKVGYRNTGIHPRNFTLTPDGSQMLVACRDSGTIEVYNLDPQTGLLSEMKGCYKMEGDQPVCLLFR